MGRKLTSCIKMKYQNNNNEEFFHHCFNSFCIDKSFLYLASFLMQNPFYKAFPMQNILL